MGLQSVQCFYLSQLPLWGCGSAMCDGNKAPSPGKSISNPLYREGRDTETLRQDRICLLLSQKAVTLTPCRGTVTNAALVGILPVTNPAMTVLSLAVLSGGFWDSERSCLGNKQLNNQWEKRPGESSLEKTFIPVWGSAGITNPSVLHLCHLSLLHMGFGVTSPGFWSDLGVWLEALLA